MRVCSVFFYRHFGTDFQMPFWMCLSQGPGSSTSRNDWHVTLLVPKFVEDQSCPEVTVTEELLAVARRWCQMWGSAHVLAAERPIPRRPQLVLAVSFSWVQISARRGACQQRVPPFCYCITSAEAVSTCWPPCDYLLVIRSPWGNKQRGPQLARMSEPFMGQTQALLAS